MSSQFDPFAQMGGVKPTLDGNYFANGRHFVRVEAVKMDRNRQGISIFVVECTVLSTSRPRANPVGSSASQVISLKHDSALPNIKAVILGLLPELRAEEVNSAVTHWIIGEGPQMTTEVWHGLPPRIQAQIQAGQIGAVQPLRGMLAEVLCTSREGKVYTVHAWQAFPPNSTPPTYPADPEPDDSPAHAPAQGVPGMPPGFPAPAAAPGYPAPAQGVPGMPPGFPPR